MEILVEGWKSIQKDALNASKYKNNWTKYDNSSLRLNLLEDDVKHMCPNTINLLDLAKNYLNIEEAQFLQTEKYGTLHYLVGPKQTVYFLGIKIPDPDNCIIVIDKKPSNKGEGSYLLANSGQKIVSFNFTEDIQIYFVLLVREHVAELFPQKELNDLNISDLGFQ